MGNIQWLEGNRISVAPPKRPKKITGTRFAAILGLNKWATPFNVWCAITRTYEEPFEDTKYTIAGKVIEPKQADYMERSYGMDIIRPSDVYGEDVFRKTWGDFFPHQAVLGGSWDYLVKNEEGNVDTVLEMKTSSRSGDWLEDVPEYYALQAALYAYLLGIDNVVMVASFLSSGDYDAPDQFVPSSQNTITVQFRVSERYPDFPHKVQQVMAWWQEHVETGISPAYDEHRDKDILKELRKQSVDSNTIDQVVAELESLKETIAQREAEMAEDVKRCKLLQDKLKELMMPLYKDGVTTLSVYGEKYEWELKRKTSLKLDEEAMERDGVLDRYKTKSATTFVLTNKQRKC